MGQDATVHMRHLAEAPVDLAAAAGAAAQQWALHHQQGGSQQAVIGRQPIPSEEGGADSSQDDEAGGRVPNGLLPCHMSFWLLQGDLAERMGISISPRARASFGGS